METDREHIHILLSYDTTESVANMVKHLKQESTFAVWERYRVFLAKQFWKRRIFWSDGYFACSMGEVSRSTIIRYIENQG